MKKLTRNQAKEIRALKRMKDDEIDFTDIPLTRDWSNAVVGKFYQPIKKSLTIRIDADVLAWHKERVTRRESTASCDRRWRAGGRASQRR